MKFRYSARDGKRAVVKGVIEAQQAKQVADILRERKLMPITIQPSRTWLNPGGILSQLRRVSVVDTTNFTRQLSTMMTAGLPLTDALNLLRLQSSPQFSRIVQSILESVQAGVSLSQALSRHSQVFSGVYVALVKAGETAGVVETILARLADSMDQSRDFSSKIKGALIYPAIILVGMVLVMIIMVWVVIPKLTSLYTDFGAQLPLSTRIIVGFSNFMVQFGWLVMIGLVGMGFAINYYLRLPQGRRQWDQLKFRLPIVGPLLDQAMLAELTRTLALLVGAGVSVVEALNVVAVALGNVAVESQLQRIAKRVEKGFPLSLSFSESEIFPPMVGQMIAVGEETGKLDDVLNKLSQYYESESGFRVKALTTAIEPLIIILLGVGVGFLVFSVIMPIYSLTSHF